MAKLIKTFCTPREIIKGTQGQSTDWEKAFTANIFDKGLLAEIYKTLLRPTNEKTGN